MELVLKDLVKEFKDNKAVNNVSYKMHNGVYGLLGVNGAGKTTLIRMICSLLQPTSGIIKFNGESIIKLGDSYRSILGYLPQEFGYYPELTVKEYMYCIASIKGIKKRVGSRIGELMYMVGLEDSVDKKMKCLSGGMKRRVGVAQALLNNPQILVLDEPTAGLDPKERIRFRNMISDLSKNRLVLLSTHIVSDVEDIANEIIFMENGRFVSGGDIDKVINEIPVNVWNVQVNQRDANEYLKKYKVVNMKSYGDAFEMRVLSRQKPNDQAYERKMSLEDVFFYYFGETGGEENGAF